MNFEEKKVFLINVSVLAIIAVAVIAVSRLLIGYLFPFVIGTVLAFVVQKPADRIAKRIRVKRGIVSAIMVAVIYLIGVGIVVIAIWQILSNAQNWLTYLSEKLRAVEPFAEKLLQKMSGMTKRLPQDYSDAIQTTVQNTVQTLIDRLTASVSKFAALTAGKIPSILFSMIVTVAASCYIAKDYGALTKFIKGFLQDGTIYKIVRIRNILVNDVLKFFWGYLILAALTFAELFAGLLLLRVRHAFIFALLIAFIDILPVLGSGTFLIPWAVFSLISGGLLRGIGLLGIYAVITVIRYFVEPKVVGNQLGIRPVFMLLVMFLGLKVGGLGGLLLFPIVFIVVIDYYKMQMKEETPVGTAW